MQEFIQVWFFYMFWTIQNNLSEKWMERKKYCMSDGERFLHYFFNKHSNWESSRTITVGHKNNDYISWHQNTPTKSQCRSLSKRHKHCNLNFIMFYPYFNSPIFPNICLFVLILGPEAFTRVKTKLKEMLLWCFQLLAIFTTPPNTLQLGLFTFLRFMPLFITKSENHPKANQSKPFLTKISLR